MAIEEALLPHTQCEGHHLTEARAQAVEAEGSYQYMLSPPSASASYLP